MSKKTIPSEVAAQLAQAEREAAHWSTPAREAQKPSQNWALPLGDYDVEMLNKHFALVLSGGSAIILYEKPGAPSEEKIRFVKVEAFKTMLQNRITEGRAPDGKIREISFANFWLGDPERRQYDGVEFHPDKDNAPGTAGYFNLWSGFSVSPSQTGSYAIFKDHLLNNICDGNEKRFAWLFGWFAQIVQMPRTKPGTSIVLRGGMGSGKTKVGDVFGSLLGMHSLKVESARYLFGQFNAHLGSCLLMQADEAIWGGDKQAEGQLRGMVTSDYQMIESKGVDPIKVRNFVRLFMTSNEDWIIPAGKDERRFAIFDVNNRVANNHGYFREMDEELNNGGREHLLHDLLHFDLSGVNLREIPVTGALLSQKVLSLDPIENWLLDRLQSGNVTRKIQGWPDSIPVATFYDDYIEASDRSGINRRGSETRLGMKIATIIPGIRKVRISHLDESISVPKRVQAYELPTLQQCREAFEAYVKQPIEWGETDE